MYFDLNRNRVARIKRNCWKL